MKEEVGLLKESLKFLNFYENKIDEVQHKYKKKQANYEKEIKVLRLQNNDLIEENFNLKK